MNPIQSNINKVLRWVVTISWLCVLHFGIMWPGRIWWPGQGLHREPQTDCHNGPFYACLQLHHVPGHPPAQHTAFYILLTFHQRLFKHSRCSCVHECRGAQEEGKLPHSRNFLWWSYDVNTILPATSISALPVYGRFIAQKRLKSLTDHKTRDWAWITSLQAHLATN